MTFSSITIVPGNSIQTGRLKFICLVNLCLLLTQTQQTALLLLATEPQAINFQKTCITAARVLHSFRYSEILTLVLTPTGPVPLDGPFPEPIACGELNVEAEPIAVTNQLIVVITIRGTFTISYQGMTYTILAATTAIVRVFSVCGALAGTWHAAATLTCFGCAAVASPTGAPQSPYRAGFSRITQVAQNHIHVSAGPLTVYS